MGKGMAAVLLLLSALAGCERRAHYLKDREAGDAQIVALCVRTDPPGATVKVDRLERIWTTPCDIADYSIQRGKHEVHVTLDGYEPVNTKVSYDGYDPAWVQLKLVPRRQTPAWMTEPKPVKPAPVAGVSGIPKPAPVKEEPPVKVESLPGGLRLKVVNNAAKLRIQAKTVVTDPDKPGEFFLPEGPPEKVLVEFLDPKTDMVLQSVEIWQTGAPAAAVKPPTPPKDPVPVVAEGDRVGEVKLVSKTYGVFVKLEPGLSLQAGEEILIFRDGKEVARTKILKITKADDNYPDGAAQVQKEESIKKGDEVRRSKP
jgi:PEGA domain-containing protein